MLSSIGEIYGLEMGLSLNRSRVPEYPGTKRFIPKMEKLLKGNGAKSEPDAVLT